MEPFRPHGIVLKVQNIGHTFFVKQIYPNYLKMQHDPKCEIVKIIESRINIILGIIESEADLPPDFWGFDYHASSKIQDIDL